MKVLVVGGGGREHGIIHALGKSNRITKLYCAPGNGGIAGEAECVPISALDLDGIVEFSRKNEIDMVIVAPDDPLAMGLVDRLEQAEIPAFGPRANAAVIESSKAFSKAMMQKCGIPTAQYRVFTDLQEALAYIDSTGAPIVVKADGLALGKGVTVAETVQEAKAAVTALMSEKRFGVSGDKVVIEQCLEGPELTVLCFTDGKTILPMLSSRDHKAAFDGGKGPNTGGMGAYCPCPDYTDEIAGYCMEHIFKPTVKALNAEGRTFKGVIYFGLMLTKDGPMVIEYNARFGDPETQPILSMLETDLLDVFEAVIQERLHEITLKWKSGCACCVVMASGGYPGSYETGHEITGLDKIGNGDNMTGDVFVYHAGTKFEDGIYKTSGGRVLGVTAHGVDLATAAAKAYRGVELISFEDARYRTDIGKQPDKSEK